MNGTCLFYGQEICIYAAMYLISKYAAICIRFIFYNGYNRRLTLYSQLKTISSKRKLLDIKSLKGEKK